MKKLIAAVLMVVVASPAFAAIQNVKVSGSIISSFIDMNNFNLGETNGDINVAADPESPIGLKRENIFVTQTELNVNADLSDNVSATVGLINERAWNAENSSDAGTLTNYANDTDVQLYLASITLREFLYSPLTLQIGRQVFNYGNGLIMGNGGAINQGAGQLQFIEQDLTERTAYDGVTATLDYKPLTISMIYFKNGDTLLSGTGVEQKNASSDVYGLNANYQLSDPWSTVAEAYIFSRINGNQAADVLNTVCTNTSPTVTCSDKGNTLFVPGLRASTNPTKSLTIQGELAWELGQISVQDAATGAQVSEHRDAMAAQVLASYTLPFLDKYKPTLNASYTYASGDKDGGANYHDVPFTSAKTYTAWDEFNTIQGAGTIYRDIFALSNEDIFSVGATVAPLEDVTAGVTWTGLWAATPYNSWNTLNIYQPNSGTATIAPVTKKSGQGLGNETDLSLTYNYTEDVTFGLSVGWFVPGSVFSNVNKDTASQAIANVAVNF
jgi:hypothetical protein